MRLYFVGLAAVRPARDVGGKVANLLQIPTGFTTDQHIQADLILKYACARGDYTEALSHLLGCGMGRHQAPFPTTVGMIIRPGDYWAVVCYDERPTGLRMPPYVLFGDGRHTNSLHRPQLLTSDEVCPPDDGPTELSRHCGYIPFRVVPTEIAALFTAAALTADLRF